VSLFSRWCGIRLRWRIALALSGALFLTAAVLFVEFWLSWRSLRRLPLENFVPRDATVVLRAPRFGEWLQSWDEGALRRIGAAERARVEAWLADEGIERPSFLTKEFRVDLARALPAEAPSVVTPERVLGAIDRDLLLVAGADDGRRAVAIATRLPFATYAALRIGLWWMAEAEEVAGVSLGAVAAGDFDLHLALRGDVLLVGTTAARVVALAKAAETAPGDLAGAIAGVEAGTIGFALDLPTLRARDPEILDAVRDVVRAIPLQEAAWTFDLDACRILSGQLVLGIDGVSLAGTAELDPARYPARLAACWNARPAVWGITDLLPESTVFASLGRGDGAGLWDCLGTLARDRSRSAIHPAIGDTAAALYSEMARMLEVAEQRGLPRELAPAMGGEAGWAVFAEPGEGPEDAVPGLALILQATESDRLLELLDRWCGELAAGEDALVLERRRVDLVDVRVLTSPLNRWPELLTPCYAMVQGRVVLSTSMGFLRRVVERAYGLGSKADPDWKRHARAAIAIKGTGAVVLDLARTATAIEATAGGLATLASDRLDKRELRDALRPRVRQESGLTGEALESRLDEEVARRVEVERRQIAAEIAEFADLFRRFAVLAGEWSVTGRTLSYRVVLLAS